MMVEGKVVHVLGPSELVINVGAENGIYNGQHFIVYALGEEIKDPDSGATLGRLEVLRGQARAKHVQAKITTLESTERRVELRDRERPVARWKQAMGMSGLLGNLETEIVTEEVEVFVPFKGAKVGDLVRTT